MIDEFEIDWYLLMSQQIDEIQRWEHFYFLDSMAQSYFSLIFSAVNTYNYF